MKKLIGTIITCIALVGLYSCDEENSPIFVAQPDVDGIVFTNTFAANYLLSEETEDNIADRFVWESADFGTDTNITYELQSSLDETFATFQISGSTSENNLTISVGQLLEFAEDLELDNDPTTTTPEGLPNNVGIVYFRLKANAGTGDAIETFSEIQPLNITWIEVVADGGCDSIFAVGEALNGIGWNFSPAGEAFCENDVLQVKVDLIAGLFRFFEVSGDWGTGLNYTSYADAGYTIDANLETEGEGDENFRFIGTPGIYTITIDNVNKTIELTPSTNLWAVGGAVPGGWAFNDDTIEFVESTPNIWSASITLSNDVFRFFQVFNVWDTNNNYAYYEDAGFTIDANLENDGAGDANFNFVGAPGTYTLTINAVEKVITLE